MQAKKYQIFISSTYEDLKDERKAVEETIIRSGDFPVGMEAFPAADEDQFEFIRSVIDDCDFYVLIIAGRYGSLAADGMSYTEKEYRYANEIGVPVIVLLRDEREVLPANMVEVTPEGREKLNAFIADVSSGRIRKSWSSRDGLKLSLREALDYAKSTKKRAGWVRGDQGSSLETLEKLVALQEENNALKTQLAERSLPVGVPANIAGLDTPVEFKGEYSFRSNSTGYCSDDLEFSVSTTFAEVFKIVAPDLISGLGQYTVGGAISERFAARLTSGYVISSSTKKEFLDTLKVQFAALGLISVVDSVWKLTGFGEQEMYRLRVITTPNPSP